MAQPESRKLSNFSFPSFTSGSPPPPLLFSTFPHCFQIFSNRKRGVHQKAVRDAQGEESVGGVVQKRAVPLCMYGWVPQLVPQRIMGVPQLLSCLSSACYGLARVMCDRRKPHPTMPYLKASPTSSTFYLNHLLLCQVLVTFSDVYEGLFLPLNLY